MRMVLKTLLVPAATFVSLVVATIVQWPHLKEVLGFEDSSDKGDKPSPEDKPPEPKCPPTIRIQPTPISTNAAHARVLPGGDSELDSDDWTSVELSYAVRHDGREIRLQLVWAAQERNKDKSRGDTKIRSSRTFTLFDLTSRGELCQASTISRIDGVQLSERSEIYYPGTVHGQRRFPNTGSLGDIMVEFDGKGNHDERVQGLNAMFGAFTVAIKNMP